MSVPIIADWRELYASDGSAPDSAPMEAYWARPRDGAPGPGVVVLMEVFGVNAHICAICERLAGEGYSALAVNYYHRTTPNRPLDYSEASLAEGRAHKDQTTAAGLLADVQAAIAFCRPNPRPPRAIAWACWAFLWRSCGVSGGDAARSCCLRLVLRRRDSCVSSWRRPTDAD